MKMRADNVAVVRIGRVTGHITAIEYVASLWQSAANSLGQDKVTIVLQNEDRSSGVCGISENSEMAQEAAVRTLT
jgi:hypothetical protein